MMGTAFFILTVLVAPFLPAGATVPRWAFLSIIAAALLFKINLRPLPLAICAYVGVMAWLAPVGYDALFLYWHFVLFAVLFCYAQQISDLRRIAIGVGLGIAINSAVASWQAFGWEYQFFIPQITAFSGLFYNRNVASEIAGMGLALAVAYRLWWLVPAYLPTLYFGARSSLVALGVAGLIGLWGRSRLAAVALTLFAVLLVAVKSDSLVSFWDRVHVWQDTAAHLTFLGRGLGSFIIDYPAFQSHNALMLRYENAHNDILQVVYELGIGGGILLLVLARRLWSVARGPAWYALVVFLIEGCFGFPLYEPVSGALAACCAGYLFSRRDDVRGLLAPVRRRVWAWPADRRIPVFRSFFAAIPAHSHAAVSAGLRRHYRRGRSRDTLDRGGAAP